MFARDDCSLSLTAPDLVQSIRATLDRAGYTTPRILEVLGERDWPLFRRRRKTLPLFLHRTRSGTSLDTFLRLFLLREPVALDAVRSAVQPQTPEDWAATGLLKIDGGSAWGTVELTAWQDLVTAADWPGWQGADPLQVMSVASTTRALDQMTLRRPVARTLDLGTGCGALAFLAARHSGEVLAVDRNPRALHFAAFNAQLNGVVNVRCLEGDLFDPVRGETFDLIVCNPPFVIGPATDCLHSHGGLPGDELCRTIVRSAPGFLRDGGFCQVLCNWAHIAGQDWRERLADWFVGSGCDAWALQFRSQNVAEYAADRIGEMDVAAEQVQPLFDTWMAEYDRQRIVEISFGLLTLRRKSGARPWIRCDQAPEVRGACGESIARGFILRDFLEAHRDDAALLRATVRAAPELRWEHEETLAEQGWTSTNSRLRVSGGLSYVGTVPPDVAAFVAQCRNGRPVRKLLAETAAAARQDVASFTPGFLKLVRRLLELGCLLPAEQV